jgi:uncharacterized protein (TIGR02001 family)
MNKKLLFSTLLYLIIFVQTSKAELKLGNIGSVTATAGVMSQYVSKGIDANSDRPTAFASIDFVAPLSFSDFYLGVWSAGATGDNYGKEVDIYAGFKKTFGIISADLGLVEYRYHSDSKSNTLNSVDYYLKLNLTPEKSPYSIGIQYFQSDSGGNRASNNAKVADYYEEIKASYDFGVIKASIAYGESNNDTDVTTVTLSKTFLDLDFGLSYIDAKKANSNTSTLNKDREYLVINASKTF